MLIGNEFDKVGLMSMLPLTIKKGKTKGEVGDYKGEKTDLYTLFCYDLFNQGSGANICGAVHLEPRCR